jgi:hypothetical protein
MLIRPIESPENSLCTNSLAWSLGQGKLDSEKWKLSILVSLFPMFPLTSDIRSPSNLINPNWKLYVVPILCLHFFSPICPKGKFRRKIIFIQKNSFIIFTFPNPVFPMMYVVHHVYLNNQGFIMTRGCLVSDLIETRFISTNIISIYHHLSCESKSC